MKHIIVISTFLVLIFSCKKGKQEETHIRQLDTLKVSTKVMSKNLDSLLIETIKYVPNSIDLSQCEILDKFDIEYFFIKDEFKEGNNVKEKIVNILLLKYYLYQLRKTHRGFNLKTMMKGNAKPLIDFYFKNNNIDHSLEFINSAVAFNILKDKSDLDIDIQILIDSIQKENKRISTLVK